MQPVTAKTFENSSGMNAAQKAIPPLHKIASQFNSVINHFNSINTRFDNFKDHVNKKFQDLTNNLQTVKNTVTAHYQALNNELVRDRQHTQQAIQRHDLEFQARDRTINAQAGEIRDLQQGLVETQAGTAALEAQSQEEKARRAVIENSVQQLKDQVQGINQAQATVIETKVKLALIEQQNAFQFKLQDEEKKEQTALKQQALTLAKTLQQFQQTFERDKKEAKAKSDEEAFKIAQLREQIVGGAVPVVPAAAVEMPEKIQEDPLLVEMENEIPDQEEAKLIALMEKGGPKGDLALLEWQTQTLSCLQEKHKISRERLSRHVQALTMKMQQLVNSYEAFKEMAKRRHEENALHIAQLSAQMEPQAKNAPDRISKLKEFRKSREINKS